MSLTGAYDPDNIFAKIIRGEAPAVRIFEDDATLAFMDVFPQSEGHSLVVHKRSRARNLLEIEPDHLHELMDAVQRLARASAKALAPDAVLVSQFNGEAAGQTVFHLHFHVIPRWANRPLGRHAGGGMADRGRLEELAKKISAAA
ncbi:MAG TPA: HIT family protein [Caulobacteraceae bacterium]|nr:HIT family protein [Caulobacteraceae bacterium]